jgi:hypothetical protein
LTGENDFLFVHASSSIAHAYPTRSFSNWRLSCRTFAANAVRLQLHPGNFLRTLATLEPIKEWPLTSLREKLIKIGAKLVSHGRYALSRWPRSP